MALNSTAASRTGFAPSLPVSPRRSAFPSSARNAGTPAAVSSRPRAEGADDPLEHESVQGGMLRDQAAKDEHADSDRSSAGSSVSTSLSISSARNSKAAARGHRQAAVARAEQRVDRALVVPASSGPTCERAGPPSAQWSQQTAGRTLVSSSCSRGRPTVDRVQVTCSVHVTKPRSRMNEQVPAPSFHTYGGTHQRTTSDTPFRDRLPLATRAARHGPAYARGSGYSIWRAAPMSSPGWRLQRIGARGRVTALDVDPGVLAVARDPSRGGPGSSGGGHRRGRGSFPTGRMTPRCVRWACSSWPTRSDWGALQVLAPGGRLVANVPGQCRRFRVLRRGIRDHVSPEVAELRVGRFSLDEARRSRSSSAGGAPARFGPPPPDASACPRRRIPVAVRRGARRSQTRFAGYRATNARL